MKRNALMLVVLLSAARATPSGALDWSYSLSGGAGAAMALGGDLDAALAEFGASVSADAAYAPVAAVSVGAGAAVRLKGSLVGTASLDVRRMGYAFWAADVGAVSWLSMWTAGVGAGLRWQPDSWYVGAGGSVLAPISEISQSSSQGGASLSVAYDVNAGRAVIPGCYLEGGLALGRGVAMGKTRAAPVAGLVLGFWPLGLVDGVETRQTSASIVVSLELERTTP